MVLQLISRGQDGHKALNGEERNFVYLPFQHSENLDDQLQSIQLYKDLVTDTIGQEFHEYAKGSLAFAKQHKVS